MESLFSCIAHSTHSHTQTLTYTHKHTQTYTRTPTHTHCTHTCPHPHSHPHTHPHTHPPTHPHTHTHIHAHTFTGTTRPVVHRSGATKKTTPNQISPIILSQIIDATGDRMCPERNQTRTGYGSVSWTAADPVPRSSNTLFALDQLLSHV